MRFKLIIVLSFVFWISSCTEEEIGYPPLSWENEVIEKLLNVHAATRGNEISSFILNNQSFECRCDGPVIFDDTLIRTRNIAYEKDSIVSYCASICHLLKTSEAKYIFSDTTLGFFVVFKYADETELRYLRSEVGLDRRWLKYFNQAGKIREHWYVSKKNFALTLPD